MRIQTERYYPNRFKAPWVHYQHLQRYHWAAEFIAGKRVLDVACGTGYGTALLAKAGAAQVDGFDCSAEAVDFAKSTWALPNATFAVATTDRLPVPDASYDVYVSFETIEHVEDTLADDELGCPVVSLEMLMAHPWCHKAVRVETFCLDPHNQHLTASNGWTRSFAAPFRPPSLT